MCDGYACRSRAYGFEMPDEEHSVLEFMSYGDFAKQPQALRDAMYRLTHAHRATVTCTRAVRDIPYANGRCDWEEFDRKWGPAIDGSLFRQGPRAGAALSYACLSLEPTLRRPDKKVDRKGSSWPVPAPTKHDRLEVDFTPAYIADVEQCLNDISRHFAAKYPKTTVLVYQDALDEAGFHIAPEEEAMAQLRSIQGYVRIFKGLGLRNVQYKLDIGAGFSENRYDLDGNGKAEGGRDVAAAFPGVPLWNVNGLRLDLAALKPAMDRGSHVWFYNGYEPRVGPTVIGAEALGPRTWPWVVWNSRIHGMCVWHFCNQTGQEDRPWETAGVGRENPHAGDALLVYPGDGVGRPGEAFASMRLKAFRRGMQDYEYLYHLASKDGNRNRVARYSAPAVAGALNDRLLQTGLGDDAVGEKARMQMAGDGRHWSHDPAAFEKARHEIGIAIGAGK